ncbi:MAG: energy-coupling factor transporter transmembrane protein EcfT [Chloroflexi bacterium]|nr:energy-coupling factor transporter transmembrane protein EcfT [Chloroflexota bacterium]
MTLEFSRNVTFGQYIDVPSFIHKLDPRFKITAVTIIMVCIFMTRGFISIAPLVFLSIIIQFASKIPVGFTLRGYSLLIRTMLFFIPFQILFYRIQPGADITYYWQWWIVSITKEGIMNGLYIFIRVIVLYHMMNMLMFTTTMIDLSDAVELMFEPLKRLKFPINELVMTMTVALKFVPLLITELERLIRAQMVRGVRFDQGNAFQRARHLGSVLIPLFVNALNRAEVLIVAMNARCYRGGAGRTKRRTIHAHRRDAVMLLCVSVLALTGAYIGRTMGI